jgi:hypothetical protein
MACDTAPADRVTDLFQARRVSFVTKAMMDGVCFMVDKIMQIISK